MSLLNHRKGRLRRQAPVRVRVAGDFKHLMHGICDSSVLQLAVGMGLLVGSSEETEAVSGEMF